MMDVMLAAASECSSGCESGWTLYLEHSSAHYSVPPHCYSNKKGSSLIKNSHQKMACDDDDDDDDDVDDGGDDKEEDLSMVSDASSGPPHFDLDVDDNDDDDDDEHEDDHCYGGGQRYKKQNNNKFVHCCKDDDEDDDDTASSPFFPSKRKHGDIHQVGNQGSSLERFVDYSSQGFSATHFQGRSSNFREHYGFSTLSSKQFPHNQWS